MAQTTPTPTPAATTDERTSPFLPRPPQFNTYSVKNGAPGIPAKLIFFIDDSDSIQPTIAAWYPGQYYKRAGQQDRFTSSVV